MTCVWVLPGPPGLRLPPSGPQDACRELVLGHLYPGGRAVPVLGPRGASCPSGPWGPGQNRSAREAGRSHKKGLRPNTSLGNARSSPPSTHPGSAVTLLIAAPKERPHPLDRHRPPCGLGRATWGHPSEGRLGDIATLPARRLQTLQREKAGFKDHSFSLPPSTATHSINLITALTLYLGTATYLILRNTQDERGRVSALQRKSCLKPSGPINTQRKIWKVSPFIWTFPPSSAQQTSR